MHNLKLYTEIGVLLVSDFLSYWFKYTFITSQHCHLRQLCCRQSWGNSCNQVKQAPFPQRISIIVYINFLGLLWQSRTNPLTWKNRNILSHTFGDQKFKIKMLQGHTPLKFVRKIWSRSLSCFASLRCSFTSSSSWAPLSLWSYFPTL